ncbi:MAG: ABC transporter ATP-binding protein/permease [Bacteroidales bacterium]|jgi:subfamily B ATP-binding cassette protein MsbA|nr:ABC transporter ATP-binding protein/permease [Bacteroidales bacterium]
MTKSQQKKTFSLRALLLPYTGILSVMLLFNVLMVIFTIGSVVLIEPLVQLLFPGSIGAGLSPMSSFFLQLINRLIPFSFEQDRLFSFVALFIALYFGKLFFQYASAWVFAPARAGVMQKMREQLYNKILSLPVSYFTEQRKGDLISRSVNDVQEVEATVLKSVQQFISEPLTVILYLIVLFYLDMSFTFFLLLLLPVSGTLIGLTARSLRKRSYRSKVLLGNLMAHVEESIQGVKVIKSFAAERFAGRLFQQHLDTFTREQKKIQRTVDIASPLSEVLGIAVVMIILVTGGIMILSGHSALSPALFITYIVLFIQIINPAKNIATAYANYRRGKSILARVEDVLEADAVILETKCPQNIGKFKEIAFKNVSFAYEKKEVLKNVSFVLHAGETLALVGASGAGKSTIADLMPRFYDVMSGEICLNHINIKEYGLNDLRALFALVPQEVILFNDTIFNNIAFGLSGVSQDAVYESAKIAGAYDFIMAMPQGFQTEVGERGLTLSGGQRQRISIARALLRESPILLLDEATSALDAESEKALQQAIEQATQNRTAFIIAHRLSTIRHADKIIVIENGEIVEYGTHDELMERGKRYFEFMNI